MITMPRAATLHTSVITPDRPFHSTGSPLARLFCGTCTARSAYFRYQRRHRKHFARGSPKATKATGLVCKASQFTEAERNSLRFGRAPVGQNFAIVVSRVAAGSRAEQEGLRAGQKLLAISSPMQSGAGGEMWSINDRPSLRFVTDAIRLNRSADIVLELTQERIINDDAGAILEDTSSTLLQSMEDAAAAEQEKETIADKLAAAYKENEQTAYREKSQRQRRIQRRKDYMARESTRDNTAFFIGLTASLFLPAVGILAYAFSSGLLDRIGSGYRPY